jgi:putative component of membrane protein insertase Oxa1/YidC/SpoIIIJ protein YidD
MILNRLTPVVLVTLIILAGTGTLGAAESQTADVDNQNPASPIRLFQKFISRADGDRCPMHPSCSHYAQEAFKRHGSIIGWILTCDRLLRCGRDETRLSSPISINGNRYAYDPLSNNTFWWKKNNAF